MFLLKSLVSYGGNLIYRNKTGGVLTYRVKAALNLLNNYQCLALLYEIQSVFQALLLWSHCVVEMLIL